MKRQGALGANHAAAWHASTFVTHTAAGLSGRPMDFHPFLHPIISDNAYPSTGRSRSRSPYPRQRQGERRQQQQQQQQQREEEERPGGTRSSQGSVEGQVYSRTPAAARGRVLVLQARLRRGERVPQARAAGENWFVERSLLLGACGRWWCILGVWVGCVMVVVYGSNVSTAALPAGGAMLGLWACTSCYGFDS